MASLSLRSIALIVALASLATAFAGCLGGPTTPPQNNSQTELAITSSAWRYDYPGSLAHSTRGQYYLNIGVSVTNRGSIPVAILAAEFSVFWQNETVGIPAMAATVATTTITNGQTGTATVAFLATKLDKPVRLEFRQAGFVNTVSANIPAPLAPPLELMIGTVATNWSATGTGNESAGSGNVFLWVNTTLMNHQSGSLTVVASAFHVEDANGSSYRADAIVGPSSLQSFVWEDAAILFEVPSGFVPKTLLVDIVLGPWTDVAVQPPG